MKHLSLLLAVLSLAGCGQSDSGPGPGGVTVGEARALDQAAAMLDERKPPAEVLVPSEGQDGTATPAAE